MCPRSSKNTIRVQPVSKQTFNSTETIIIRLPTNAIVDLHTLVLSMDAGAYSVSTSGSPAVASLTQANFPRYTQSLFRRVDVTAGGVQVGLGSLSDYGAVWSLMALNTLGQDKHNELAKFELGGELAAGGNYLGAYVQSGQDNTSQTLPNFPPTLAGITPAGATVQPTGATAAHPHRARPVQQLAGRPGRAVHEVPGHQPAARRGDQDHAERAPTSS